MHDVDLKEHQARINRLQHMDRKEILAARLKSLLQDVQSGNLTIEDLLKYTNISREQLQRLLEGGYHETRN